MTGTKTRDVFIIRHSTTTGFTLHGTIVTQMTPSSCPTLKRLTSPRVERNSSGKVHPLITGHSY